MANICLIRPYTLIAVSTPASPTCAPIGLAYIAASVRQAGHNVQVIDAVGEAPAQLLTTADPKFITQGLSQEQLIQKINVETEIIGISCMYSYEWPTIRALINAIRNKFPRARIVLGGEHSSALPEFCLSDCPSLDVSAIGEGEETMVELANLQIPLEQISGIAYKLNGKICTTNARKRIKAIDDIPQPAWDLFPLENYLGGGYGRGVNRGRNMPMISSRGCPYRCTFCSNESMWGPQWISRDPALVVAEIKEYVTKYQISNFDFYDLTTIVNRTWTINFCNLLIESGVNFTWQLASGTRSEAIDEEVAQLLAKAGCSNISYAPESGSESVLKRIKKKINLQNMKRSMKYAERAGVICKTNILIGFPGETHREIWQTMKFCAEVAFTGMHDLSVYPFSPYPGSALYAQLRKENRIAEVNDAYFYQLALANEFGAKPPSFSEHIPTSQLGLYRFLGIAIFYFFSYLTRPIRIYKLIKNIFFNENQETLLESVLHDKLIRRKKKIAATK